MYFAWELQIPLITWFIIPYMSIDLFFVGAPFLCGDRERAVLAKRVTLGILIAGLFFMAMPLRLGYGRQEPDGALGAIFALLFSFDPPYGNLFPSLHITLRTILADVYARHTRGWLRAAVVVWFSLVGFSTIFTHQHHLADVAGGFVLAAFCLHYFREENAAGGAVPNVRVGHLYAAAAFVCAVAAIRLAPWGAFLIWPAASFGTVAAGYYRYGGRVYGKVDGRIPLSSLVALAPCILGQYLSLQYYRRQCNDWDEVVRGVFLGRALTNKGAARAIGNGVTAVLDVTAEFSENAVFRAIKYHNLPVLDLTAPTQEQLIDGATFIKEELRHGAVYVHCKIGYSRSSAFVAAYLIESGTAHSVPEAIALIRKKRPAAVVRKEIVDALEELYGNLNKACSVSCT
ncbi:MAG: dual specificity protein phosphatase family protein [Candidatus Hydrogenedentes bacterium]|nr:dual specificity protein phosphatase family protein [Candidatus Hydrogenedentota bacterium]